MFWFIGGFLVGVLVGCLFTHILLCPPCFGTLLIDTSDEEPYLFAELDTDPETLENDEIVAFRVHRHNFTQEPQN